MKVQINVEDAFKMVADFRYLRRQLHKVVIEGFLLDLPLFL